MKTRYAARLSAALAAIALSTAHVGGQVVQSVSERGWIGVSFDIVETTASAGAVATVVDVSAGSPAERAGIRAGDVLVSINGRGWEEELARTTETLRSGDLVRMVLDRGGQRLLLRLTAGARPVQMAATPAWSFSFQVDSVADLMYRAMDSLRIHLVQKDGSVRLLRVPGAPGDPTTFFYDAATMAPLPPVAPSFSAGEPRFGFPEAEATDFALVQEVRAPFAFYLFRGEIHDSLRQEMDQLNGEIRRLRSQEAIRSRDVARVVASSGGRGVGSGADDELRLVQERLTEYGIRAERLRDAMTRAARSEATSRQTGALRDAPGAPPRTSGAPEGFFRPLTPYVLGQNRAAGAEVVELGPELAEYFHVDGGVLVVDVPPGTPAALAGMEPGDVVTHVDGTAVRSIEGVRAGIVRGRSDPTLTLVRKGRRLEVLLRR